MGFTQAAELNATMPPDDALASAPLLARSMTYWNDPAVHLLWLEAFLGDRNFFEAPPGTPVTITIHSSKTRTRE